MSEVAAALAALPLRQQQVVVLHLVLELTYAEVGEVLGFSHGRAFQLYQKALPRLRQAIARAA